MTVPHRSIPVQLEELEPHVSTFFTERAEELARDTKFVLRSTKITGAIFLQTLVFGWLACPDASYTQLQQMMALCGCQASAQALQQRFTHQAADFLLAMLYELTFLVMAAPDLTTALLQKFCGVFMQDGTIISLPQELEPIYQGHGGNTETSGRSALRVQVRLNLTNGALEGPWLQDARACEQKGPGSLQQHPLPPGALFLADSAYFPLQQMRTLTQEGVWWITHAKADLVLHDARGVRYTLVEYIKRHQDQKVIDATVTLGQQTTTRQQVRLLAFRVSEETECKRREQVNQRSKTRGKGCRRDVQVGKKHQRPQTDGRHLRHPGKRRIELLGWTILLTNAPDTLLTPFEARALMRARWQSELIWRLWKERGQVDIWRSQQPMRILCEVYAKLIGMIVQHWLIIVGCWADPHRSLVKASHAVRLLAPAFALTLLGPVSFQDVLRAGKRAMARSTLNTCKKRPSTSRLLETPSLAAGSAGGLS